MTRDEGHQHQHRTAKTGLPEGREKKRQGQNDTVAGKGHRPDKVREERKKEKGKKSPKGKRGGGGKGDPRAFYRRDYVHGNFTNKGDTALKEVTTFPP